MYITYYIYRPGIKGLLNTQLITPREVDDTYAAEIMAPTCACHESIWLVPGTYTE